MIEKTILDYLNEHASIPWYMETPKDPPAKYGLIQKTGSSMTDHIYRATIALQVYADSMYEAADLNEETKELMFQIVSLNEIASSRLNSDYNYTNTATKKYRYQAVFDLTHYGG